MGRANENATLLRLTGQEKRGLPIGDRVQGKNRRKSHRPAATGESPRDTLIFEQLREKGKMGLD